MAAWSRRWNAKKVKPLNKISELLIDVILHRADELITSQRCDYLNILSEMERSTSVSSQSNWRSQHRVTSLFLFLSVLSWRGFVLYCRSDLILQKNITLKKTITRTYKQLAPTVSVALYHNNQNGWCCDEKKLPIHFNGGCALPFYSPLHSDPLFLSG